MIHFDTNAIIAILNEDPPQVRHHFVQRMALGIPMAVSVIVMHELLAGARKSALASENEQKLNLFLGQASVTVATLDLEDATQAADIRDHLRRQGRPIGPYDLLIAAQARRRNATLVTANTREFERVPGLMVANWAA